MLFTTKFLQRETVRVFVQHSGRRISSTVSWLRKQKYSHLQIKLKNKIEQKDHLHILPTIDIIYTLYNYKPAIKTLVSMNDWSSNDHMLDTGPFTKTGIPLIRAPYLCQFLSWTTFSESASPEKEVLT